MEIVLVNTDSPAWHAGIKFGDVLLEINGNKVNNIAEYRANMNEAYVNNKKPTLEFKVIRKGQVKIF